MFQFLKKYEKPSIVDIQNGKYIDKKKNKIESIQIKNAIISGTSNIGKTKLFDFILNDALSSNMPIIYIRNRINNNYTTQIALDIENGTLNKYGYNTQIVDIDKAKSNIQLQRGFSKDQLIDNLISIISMYINIDDTMNDFIKLWYSKILDSIKLTKFKEKFSLSQLDKYSYYYLADKYDYLYNNKKISKIEYITLKDELDKINGMYQSQIMKLNLFINSFKSSSMDKILSGNLSITDIYNNNISLLINLSANSKKESNIYLKTLISRLILEETKNVKSAIIVFEDVDLVNCFDEFIDLLKIVNNKNTKGSIYFTLNDISNLINSKEISSNPATYCNCYFIFKQNNKEDIKFWSESSGAIKKIEKTNNLGPISSVYRWDPTSWPSILFGRKMVKSGISEKEIDTHNVEEFEIDSLDDFSSINIIKMNNFIYTKRVSWR